MIINKASSDVMEVTGDVSSKKATINQNKIRKLQYILTEGLYKDPIGAVINEISANAIDSVRESGKDPIKNPVVVTLGRSGNKFSLSIQDKGIGMDKDFFENVFMDMLSSTKEDDSESIGHFGIGGKSWSSLKRAVTFTVVKDGNKCKFLCFKGEEFIEHEVLLEETTKDENGVTFELPINDWQEYQQFIQKAKYKLAYYDTVALIIDGQLHQNTINRTEDFQWSADGLQQLHLCLKDVVYAIDYQRLGIPVINIPIALRFGLNDGIVPTPSREDILYSKETIQLIKDKLSKVAEYLVIRYNAEVVSFEDIHTAYPFINNHYKQVELEGTKFTINDILPYSGIQEEDAKLKGAVLNNPRFYQSRYVDLLEEWDINAVDDHAGRWKKKNIYYYFKKAPNNWSSMPDPTIVRVNKGLAGHVKEFLREKYGENTVYIEETRVRTLDSYKALLLLTDKEETWRAKIQEWQTIRDNLWNTWKDERKVEDTKKFKKWIENKKATQKANRKQGITNGKHQVLNKQKDEVTLHYARQHSYGNVAVFDKKTKKISELDKMGKLTVLLTQKEMEKKEWLHNWLAFKEVQFIYVGERDRKYVKNKHIVSMEEFKKTKPFARLATACLANELWGALPDNEELIYEAFPKYKDIKQKIEDYIGDEGVYIPKELIPIVLEEATEFNNWDFNIYSDILEFQKIIRKFGFIDLIQEGDTMTEEQKKIAKNMLYVLLKHNKITHHLLEEMELVDKKPIKNEV